MTQLWWQVRRAARTARLLPARIRHRTTKDASTAFALDVLTNEGDRVLESLGRLADQIAGDWTVDGVESAPPAMRFSSEAGPIAIRVEPKSDRSFADTRFFSILYQGSSQLGDEAEALLKRCVDAVAIAETDPAWRDLIRKPRLSRVSYYPSTQRLELRPSLVCNHSCGFCNSVDRTGTDNAARGIDDILSNVDKIAALPVTLVAISGGEPTLQRRLPELISQLAQRGIEVELQTNGMALADADYARSLRKAGLSRVLISLHSARPDESDESITGFEGAWHKTTAGIEQAIETGFRVDLSHVIHSDNAGQTREFLELLHQRWGRRVNVRMAFVAPTGAAREAASTYVPALETVVPNLVSALAFARERRLRVYFVGYCGIPPCLLQPEEGFSEIVRLKGARSYNDNHTKLPACATCKFEDRCPGLWTKYVELHGDPGLRPM